MGKMIKIELYKIFQKPLLMLLFFGCLILHLGFLWYQETTAADDGYSLQESMEGVSSGQLSKTEQYETYREEIIRQADQRMHSPLFANMDAYTYDNLKYTKAAYETLGKVEVQEDFDGGVLLMVQNRLADIFCLLLLLIFVLRLFVEERENDTWFLLKSMKRGHGELLAAKWITLAALTFGTTVLFYGSSACFIGQTIGFGDLDRSLQSVEGFMPCTLRLSVGEFLLFFFLLKIFCLFAVAVAMVILGMLLKNTIFTVVAVAMMAIAELLCWQNITINSWVAPFKELNLAALIFTEHYFSDFYHINLATLAVNHRLCGALILVFCLAGGIFLSWLLHEKEIFLTLPKRKPVKRKRVLKRTKSGRIFSYEAYKIFVMGKGWGAILFFSIACFLLVSAIRFYMSESEYYYREYSMTLQGELSEEKENFLTEERERLSSLPPAEVSAQRKGALDRAEEQYMQMKALENQEMERQGMEIQYVYLTPWQYLLGEGLSLWDKLNLALCFLTIILLTSSCGAVEKKNEMYGLLSLTKAGKQGIIKKKICCIQLTALGISCAAFLPGIFQIHEKFGITGANALAASYKGTDFWGASYSLGALLIFKYVAMMLAVLAAGYGMLLISEKVKSRIFTILIGAVVLLVPVCVLMLL